ncbi:MAG: 30S ribosomal protein S6e [Candidatus Bathyarchaeota archaeon]|nr:30S ribosomal protein S6e [Candidatus Bathyarchaeota archaeon]
MARFKLVISSPDGSAKTVDLEGARAQTLVGKRVGETLDGSIAGVDGKLLITGGSDKDGYPVRGDVHGGARKAIILSGGTGFNPTLKGERRRKAVRGNVITDNLIQINIKAIEEPTTKAKKPTTKAKKPTTKAKKKTTKK